VAVKLNKLTAEYNSSEFYVPRLHVHCAEPLTSEHLLMSFGQDMAPRIEQILLMLQPMTALRISGLDSKTPGELPTRIVWKSKHSKTRANSPKQ
jgi:hypothetical protein